MEKMIIQFHRIKSSFCYCYKIVAKKEGKNLLINSRVWPQMLLREIQNMEKMLILLFSFNFFLVYELYDKHFFYSMKLYDEHFLPTRVM